jgi:hypothetical protein
VEYDGEQHFRPVRFGGISEDEALQLFRNTKQRDRLKNRKIKAYNNDIKYFIRFSYKDDISTDGVLKKLEQNNIPIFKG